MSTAKKKRRRSSLAAAKNKLEFSPGLGKGLHSQVDNSLPPEDRLEQLSKLCLKYAVDRISCDTESQEVKDGLEAVLSEVPNVFAKPELKEALKHACHTGRLQPNPLNTEMEETSREIEARIARLKQEEEEWHEHFRDLDIKIAEAERKAGERTLPASELTANQRDLAQEYLPAMSDLTLISRQVTEATNKAHTLVLEHEKNFECLSQVQEEVNSKLDKKLKHLHEKSCGSLGSPKAKIQNIIDFPTPPSEPMD